MSRRCKVGVKRLKRLVFSPLKKSRVKIVPQSKDEEDCNTVVAHFKATQNGSGRRPLQCLSVGQVARRKYLSLLDL